MPSSQQNQNIVQSSLALPIGSCRRRRRQQHLYDRMIDPITTVTTPTRTGSTIHSRESSNTDRYRSSDLRNSVLPATCRYILINKDDGKASSTASSCNVTKIQPSTTLPVWYLCRMLVADELFQDDPENDIDQNNFSVLENDEPSSMEYFQCALNVALIGYDPISSPSLLSSSKRIAATSHDHPSHSTTIINAAIPKEFIPITICESSIDDHHVNALLRPIPTSSTFLVPLDHRQPIQLSSVFMTYKCTSLLSSSLATSTILSSQPLLQSCLKRLFVGCPIGVWNRGPTTKSRSGGCEILLQRTTQIKFIFDQMKWTFIVDSVTTTSTTTTTGGSPTTTTNADRKTNNDIEFEIGIILPSTRITFIHPIARVPEQNRKMATAPTSLSSNTNSDLYKSPAVRMLLDAIHCIHQIQNTPSSSSVSQRHILGDIPRVFLLSGPPGVGKTHAIRTVVNAVSTTLTTQSSHDESRFPACHLVTLQGSEILSMGRQYSDAANALERCFRSVIQQMRNNTNITIIFLDEFDALLSTSNNESSSIIIESTLGRLLDQISQVSIYTGGDPVHLRMMVVAATNRVDAIPASLRRPGRFDREIPMVPPNATTRLEIIQSLVLATKNDSYTETNIEGHHLSLTEMRDIADLCVGFVPADLAAVVRKVELLRISQIPATSDMNRDDMVRTASISPIDVWTRAVTEVGASALRDAALTAPPTTKWDDIAGDPGGAKTALRQAIEWPRTKRVAYERLGLTPPRGILLHGPPGCAKTTLARAAAGASAVSFLSLSPADVYSTSYVGDAEAVIRRAFTLARSASPCVLFFDEIDAILGMDENHSSHGMGRGSAVEARVLSTFLNEMDGVDGSWRDGVLVLGATNRPWTLDTALLRPGRFDKVIYVPPPDFDGRKEIISMHCQHWSKHIPEESMIDIDYFASDAISGNMTGAEIVGACREAAMLCFREATSTKLTNPSTLSTSAVQLVMKQEYLETALKNVRPLLSNILIMEAFESFQIERIRQVGS